MARIVAIGGGEIGRPDFPDGTLDIDAEIVRLSGVRRPRVLFLPTATTDDRGYVAIVDEHFRQRLGCAVEPLLLYDRGLAPAEIERAIRSADVVYVGGGNTLRMMKMWRRRGVDRLLLRAAADGTVLAGISAGAMCWCSYGVSDSRSFTSPDESWEYITVRGLGLLDVVLCPHFDADPRRPPALRSATRRHRTAGLGLDDCTALEVVDDRWRILSSGEGGSAHLLGGSGVHEELAPGAELRPLAHLTSPSP